MKATFEKKHHDTTTIVTFWFRPEKKIDYSAGQFVELSIPHNHPDDRGIKRWFTLSSSPTDTPLVSITTKLAGKSSSFKTALQQLTVGDDIIISDAMGDFILPKDSGIPLIFVAGGIGITPFRSIISYVVATQEKRDITLLYAVNNDQEILFYDLFQAAGIRTMAVVNQPSTIYDHYGQLSAERILALSQPPQNALIYLAGPEPMTEAFSKGLEALHIAKHRIVTDFFPGYVTI